MFDRHVVNSINSIFSNAAKSFHAVQSHIEPAVAGPAVHSRYFPTPPVDELLDDINGYDHFQECAEVALLRASPRHARSILMDSTH